jgi:nitroreductase
MEKPADAAYPLAPIIGTRWSPRAFEETPLRDSELGSLMEAFRWAASCFNDQPWRLIVARKGVGDGWQRLFDCLTSGNQAWCARVPVLMLSVAVPEFRRNGKPNRHAQHDVGMASAQMALQATAMGLATHFMAGFDRGKAREVFGIPEACEPMAAIAVGRQAAPDILPEPIRARETASRQRLPLAEIAFGERWGEVLPLVRAAPVEV